VLENEVKRRNTTLCYVVTASDQVRPTMILTSASERTSTELVLLQVVAYIIFTTTHLVVQITKLGVHPSCRRQGIARHLLQVMFCCNCPQEYRSKACLQQRFLSDDDRSAFLQPKHSDIACSVEVCMLTAPTQQQ